MDYEEYDNYEEQDEYVSDTELVHILNEYQRHKLIENLTGPSVSLVMHLILLVLGFVYIATSNHDYKPPIVVEHVVVDEIKLEPEIEDEIDDIVEDLESEDIAVDAVEAPSQELGEETSPVDVSDEAPQTNDDMDMEEVCDVVRYDSPLTFTGGGGRTDAGRRKAIGKTGGKTTGRGQGSLTKALKWLAKVQNSNGSWGDGNFGPQEGHPAHTGLALLVFLAHGETPLSEKYGTTVQNAMRWLAGYGSAENLPKICKRRPMGYAHGIATYALAESFAMTKIPFLQSAMESSVDVLIDGQMMNGGFGYGYTSEPRWDLSVAGWNFQALKAARMAGCSNEKLSDAIKKSIRFCKMTSYAKDGAFYYAPNAKTGNPSIGKNMTGVGAVCMQLMGAGSDPKVAKAADKIEETHLEKYNEIVQNPGQWNSIGGDYLYGFYYSTQVMFNTQNKNKARWRNWRDAFEKVLIRAQHPEGFWQTNGQHKIGSHDTPGRVLSTCLCALQLTVYYRYLPSFDAKKIENDNTIHQEDILTIGEDDGMVIEL